MILFRLEPEVAGGHGEHTVYGQPEDIAKKGISGKVQYMHYVFEGWLGDELLESTPVFIISSVLETVLRDSAIGDYELEPCLITTSDMFDEWHPDIELPTFIRFIPLGSVVVNNGQYTDWSGHHFCLSQRGWLVVTEDALQLLRTVSMQYCNATPITRGVVPG